MFLESGQEIAPGLRGLGLPLGVVDGLPVADGVDAVGDQQGHVLVGPYPAAFEIAAIDENLAVAAKSNPFPRIISWYIISILSSY